jgi:hypothetical protein
MLDEYNKAFDDEVVASIIAAINRRDLILDQHADQYGVETDPK